MLHLIVNLYLVLLIVFVPATSIGEAKPLNVVSTTSMVGDAAKEVGGERVSVRALMGEGVDPHLYKAAPGDMRLLSDADLVFYNGLHLEGKMSDVLQKLSLRKPVFAVADGIDKSLLRSPPEFEGQHDPHIWFDVSLWIKCVEGIRDILSKQDPEGSSYYSKRTEEYLKKLTELHEFVRRAIATIPKRSRILVTAHDAFGYFGRAYDIEVKGIQGISTDSEASIREMNSLVDLLVERKVRAVFVESSVPRKAVEALIEGAFSKGHSVQIGGELYSDAMGKEGTPEGSYIGMVRHNVNLMVRALKDE